MIMKEERSEEHTSELQSQSNLVCRLLLEKKTEAKVPSIYSFLPNEYDRFLVTPSSLSWYFPAPFVKNSGLKEIHSYENLRFKIKETFHSLGHYIARDEVETVDFFIRRL